MPTWLEIVLAVLVVAIVLLTVAGMSANARRQRAREGSFETRLDEANRALAAAHAADRGWEPATVEAAARSAFLSERPGAEVRDVTLVQVIDPPGTDEDKALFRVLDADGSEAMVRLGRRDGTWVLDELR